MLSRWEQQDTLCLVYTKKASISFKGMLGCWAVSGVAEQVWFMMLHDR